jgi:hypothetical protein
MKQRNEDSRHNPAEGIGADQWIPYELLTLPDGASALMPVVRLRLRNGRRGVTVPALIDSGSDASWLPRAVARQLGSWPLRYSVMGGSGARPLWGGGISVRASIVVGPATLPLMPGGFFVPRDEAAVP